MSHQLLIPFIVKVSVLDYFPLIDCNIVYAYISVL